MDLPAPLGPISPSGVSATAHPDHGTDHVGRNPAAPIPPVWSGKPPVIPAISPTFPLRCHACPARVSQLTTRFWAPASLDHPSVLHDQGWIEGPPLGGVRQEEGRRRAARPR